jgi:hypothetical protein
MLTSAGQQVTVLARAIAHFPEQQQLLLPALSANTN